MDGFRVIFGGIRDPRDFNASHQLIDILFVALAACLCGANSYPGFAEFGRAKEALLRRFVPLKHGIPSADTFERVFRHLDPAPLEAALVRFVAVLAARASGLAATTMGRVVAVDGKRLRGAYDPGGAPMSPILVSAYLNQTRLVLGQTLAPGGGEVEGVLRLLDLIALQGATVTADALHCTRKTAAALRAKGADYVLALKGNRSTLAQAAADLFKRQGAAAPTAETREHGHGRSERRRARVIAAPPAIVQRHGFRDLAAFGYVETWRTLAETTSRRRRTFVLSRPMLPAELLATVREHWSIENDVHWELDVVFDEDRCRTRKNHGPRNLATLRKISLNMLRTHPAAGSLVIKRQRAAWNETFLLELFTHLR